MTYSVNLKNIKLKPGVVVADSHPQQMLSLNQSKTQCTPSVFLFFRKMLGIFSV